MFPARSRFWELEFVELPVILRQATARRVRFSSVWTYETHSDAAGNQTTRRLISLLDNDSDDLLPVLSCHFLVDMLISFTNEMILLFRFSFRTASQSPKVRRHTHTCLYTCRKEGKGTGRKRQGKHAHDIVQLLFSWICVNNLQYVYEYECHVC